MSQHPTSFEATQSIDLTKFEPKKPPSEADSSLEFMLLLLCGTLKLAPGEVLTLFTNHNKYLAHLIVKGFKDDFDPVVAFYTHILSHIHTITKLFEADPKSRSFTLYALKPGFVSKSEEVVSLTLKVFSQVAVQYEWFVGESKCLQTVLMGIRRHPELGGQFGEMLVRVAGEELVDLLKNQYKDKFENPVELLYSTGPLLSTFDNPVIKEKLQHLKIIQDWVDLALQAIENSDRPRPEYKSAGIKFLTSLWIAMPEQMESNENTYNRFVNAVKQDWKTRPIEEFLSITTEVFSLFSQLTTRKNPSAKIILDLLGIILEQLIECEDQRCIMLGSFLEKMTVFPAMPPLIFLQHYADIRVVQPFDLEFMQRVVHSPSLNSQSATALETICGRLIAESFLNRPLVQILIQCVGKYPEESLETISRISKQILTVIFNYQKSRKTVNKPLPSYNNKKPTVTKVTPQMENEIITAQHLLVMVDCLKRLVDISSTVKEKISPLVTSTSTQLRHFKKEPSKLMTSLLTACNATICESSENETLNPREGRDYMINKGKRSLTTSELIKESQVKNKNKAEVPESVSRHLQLLRESVVEKKKKIQQEQVDRGLEEENQKQKIKKEVERIKFLKGFGGETQLMEEGYWEKKVPQKERSLELVDPDTFQACETQYIDIVIKKYHRVLRQMFLKYAATGYSSKNPASFDQQLLRTETLSIMECIKMLKENKLFGLTDLQEVQGLVRQVNIKILKKRETQEFDYAGFEQFVVQFALIVFSRPHSIVMKQDGDTSDKQSDSNNIPAQILEKLFLFLRNVSDAKGESTVLFDEPDTAYFNETEVIREFNRKLEEDPGFILPEGYKKIIDRSMQFEPTISPSLRSGSYLPESYINCYQIVNDIIVSAFGVNSIEPVSIKTTKAKAKPCVFVNIQSKINHPTEEAKAEKPQRFRGLSSQEGKKPSPLPLLEKKTLSFGMKLGLSYVPYKDKMLGEQVAYVIDDMIKAIQRGKGTIEKDRIVNPASKQKQHLQEEEHKEEQEREKKRHERKKQLDDQKREQLEKKEKEKMESFKLDEEKKKKEEDLLKRKEEEKSKYIQSQKVKVEEQKKQKDEELKQKIEVQKANKKKKLDEGKKKFSEFNEKQISRMKEQLKSKNVTEEEKRRKQEEEEKAKQANLNKIRVKYKGQDEAIKEIKQKTVERLTEIFESEDIQSLFKKHELSLKTLFEFLIKSTYLSLTDKGHNNEVVQESWIYYNIAFKVSPHILSSKEVNMIFTSLTKSKDSDSKYKVGLDYRQFLHSLLRSSIKKKTFFNAIGQMILQNRDSEDKPVPIDIETQQLLKQEPANENIIDDYGDLSKVGVGTLEGYLYYLKLPMQKNLLDRRLREVQEEAKKRGKDVQEDLKQQLNKEMPTSSGIVRKKRLRIKKEEEEVEEEQQASVEAEGEVASEGRVSGGGSKEVFESNQEQESNRE